MSVLLFVLEDIGIASEVRTPVPSVTAANNIPSLDSMNETNLLDLCIDFSAKLKSIFVNPHAEVTKILREG